MKGFAHHIKEFKFYPELFYTAACYEKYAYSAFWHWLDLSHVLFFIIAQIFLSPEQMSCLFVARLPNASIKDPW